MENINTADSGINLQLQSPSLNKAKTIVSSDSDVHPDVSKAMPMLEKAQPGVTVDISAQGKKALEEEKSALAKEKLGQEIANQLHANHDEEKQVEKTSDNPFDRVIAMLKEQIREVKQQLAKLENDDSESAEKQREMLNGQLLELNGQLIAAFEQKMQAEKQAGV